ncbi:MAG: PKD domain-containing protein, partial [Bacteroidia bacterium]
LSGTSMACPLVAGLCGLMLSFNPSKSPDDIELCLKSTADNIYPLNPSYLGQLGAGRINALAALQCVSGPPVAQLSANYLHTCVGQTVQFSDNSFGSPTTWSWNFVGGTPSSSTLQNPSVVYSVNGVYPVFLQVSNALGTDTFYHTTYIEVGVPTATLSGGGIINPGYTAFLQVNFTGSAPYGLVYTDGTNNYPLSGITSNLLQIPVSPAATTTYSLVSMTSAQCVGTVSGTGIVTISNGCTLSPNFQQIFGKGQQDYALAVRQTNDCGYVVGGYTYSLGAGLFNPFLSKLDNSGNVLWMKTYGAATYGAFFQEVIPVSNGFVAAGYLGANNIGRVYVVKTDINGVLLWSKWAEFVSGGGAVFSNINEILELPNGNIILVGRGGAANFNDTGQILIGLDGATGNVLWTKDYQNNSFEQAAGVSLLPNGNLLVVGASRSWGVTAGLFDVAISTFDATTGNFISSKNYGQNANDYGNDLVLLADGSYIAVGQTESYNASVSDILVSRIGNNGTPIWAKTFSRNAADYGLKIISACNNSFYIISSSQGDTSNNDLVIMRIDANGNQLWAKSIGGQLDEHTQVGAGATGDCGCIVASSTLSFGAGENDAFIVKTDSLGNFDCHAENVILSEKNITLTQNNSTLTSGVTPSFPTFTIVEQNHVPQIPDSVCTACGVPIAEFDIVYNVMTMAFLNYSINADSAFWDFGDGNTSSMFSAVHQYTATGTFAVTMYVFSACGTDTLVKNITLTGANECVQVLQPGPIRGKDASIFSRDDATNSNSGNAGINMVGTWTWSGNVGSLRSLIEFDLSYICPNTPLLDAKLNAYHNAIWGQPHSGSNGCFLQQITQPWLENSVTWNNQPSINATGQIIVPQTVGTNHLIGLNVTPLFQSFINGPNYGFLWRNQVEQTYVRTYFASSDWGIPEERMSIELTFDPLYAYSAALPTNTHSVQLCAGDSVQLFAAGYLTPTQNSGASLANKYKWIPSTGLSCDDCPTPKASPNQTTTYQVIVYSCAACADIDTVQVIVSQVNILEEHPILCNGDSITLHAVMPNGNGAGITYSWFPTTNLTGSTTNTPTVFPSQSTTYYVYATDLALNCLSVDSVYVQVAFPPVLPNLIADTTICSQVNAFPDLVQIPLLSNNFTPIGGDFYQWTPTNLIQGDVNTPNVSANINLSQDSTYTIYLTVSNFEGCINRDSIQFKINTLSISSTITDDIDCFGGNALVNVAVTGGNSPYTGAGTNLSYPAGTHYFTVTDDDGCQIRDTLIITQPAVLQATASTANIVCNGQTATITVSATGGTSPYSGTGTFNQVAGTYVYTVTDAKGCTDNTPAVILTDPDVLIASLVADSILCYGTKAMVTISATGGIPNYTGVGNFQANAGFHQYVVTDKRGCKDSITVNLGQPTKLQLQLTPIHAYCDWENGGANSSVSGGTPQYTYSWDTSPTQFTQDAIGLGAGMYKLFVTDANDCKTSRSVILKNTPPAIADFSTNPSNAEPIFLSNATIQFKNQSIYPAGSLFSWYFGDGYTTTTFHTAHTYADTGTYTVILMADNGFGECPTYDSSTFIIKANGSIFVPNAFTPNGDGINDFFLIKGEGIVMIECILYDRWGKEIKILRSLLDTWDGKHKNQDVPEGAYTYKLTAKMNDGKQLLRGGTVTILR